jgi:hypothetical protein
MARVLCMGKIFRSEVMSQLFHQAVRAFDHAGHREWFVVLLVVGIAGLFLLRGFGSRSQY